MTSPETASTASTVTRGAEEYVRNGTSKNQKVSGKCGMAFNWRLAAALALVVGLVGLVFVCLLYSLTGGVVPFDHGVIIDAGSSHSEALLYRWQGEKDKGTGEVIQIDNCAVEGGGISSYQVPKEAGQSLMPCLHKLALLVPEEKRAKTPVFLGATAGMRLLSITNPYQSIATFTAIQCAIPLSSMMVMDVGIISGPAEGIFAWITTNFLLGTVQRKEHPTVGAADMGGASTQISFEVDPSLADHPSVSTLRLYGEDYHVYSVTYLCYGSFEVYRRYLASLISDPSTERNVDNPCGNPGQVLTFDAEFLFDQPCTKTKKVAEWVFLHPESMTNNYTFTGTADVDQCRKLVADLFEYEVCSKLHQECFSKIDPLARPEKFMVFSSYYWTMDFMKAKEQPLKTFRNNVKEFCDNDWNNITSVSYPSSVMSVLPRYCFQGIMVEIILTNGYGFNDTTWSELQFTHKVKGTSVGWALGYMINATNAIPEEVPSSPAIGTAAFAVLLVVCVALLVAGFIFCTRAKRKVKLPASQMP